MISKAVLKEFSTVVGNILLAQNQLTIRDLGTFRIESVPSLCEQVNPRKFVVNPPSKRVFLDHTSAQETDLAVIKALASSLGIPHTESEAVIHLLAKEIIKQVPTEIPGLGAITQSGDDLCFTADPELAFRIAGRYANMAPVEITRSIPARQAKKNFPTRSLAIVAMCIAVIGGYFILNSRGLFQNTVTPSDPIAGDSSISIASSDSFSIAEDAIIRIDDGTPSQEQDNFPAADDLTTVPPISLPTEADVIDEPEAETNMLDRSRGGYTIIVGSFGTPDQANRVVEQFRSLYPELPVDTLRSPERTRYRVALGQVRTNQEAVALQNRLNDLPPGTWILNILNQDI